MQYEVVIGLEVHAQIVSDAKLFSDAPTSFGADPNTQIAFLDAGMPGQLPVLNYVCVDQAIKTGLGLNASIERISIFDRKNYFYPDLPLGYQISQYSNPIVRNGYLDISGPGFIGKRIRINRLHLEQDAGKSIHDLSPKYSYIDLNRAGVALMEIVSEPDLSSADEAMAYVKKLRSILRYLGTCDGNMERGNLRVDINISLRCKGGPLGTRAEIKNVNSIRFIGQAIAFEIERQKDILESGGKVIQETRLFDPNKGETRSLRQKEDDHDYRYFPDPDLRPLILSEDRIENIKRHLPELPDQKVARLCQEFGLSIYEADILTSEKEISDYYEHVLTLITKHERQKSAKMLSNWLIGEVFGLMNKEGIESVSDLPFQPNYLAELMDLILDETISGKMGKELFVKLWHENKSPRLLVSEFDYQQITDPEAIHSVIVDVLNQNQSQAESYRQGKVQLLGFFVGLVMKTMKGKANPSLVNKILKNLLDKEI